MYKPVYVPFAVTQHGERVEPKTATQEDYDTLPCEFCRLKISVVIVRLRGTHLHRNFQAVSMTGIPTTPMEIG